MLWWILAEPEGAGYVASGFGGQRIAVFPEARRVVVAYLSVAPSFAQVDDKSFQSLDSVFTSAFRCGRGW